MPSLITKRQMIFCKAYMKSFSVAEAADAAGFNHGYAYRMIHLKTVREQLDLLRMEMVREMAHRAVDILKLYEDIAFADIREFVEIIPAKKKGQASTIRIRDPAKLDGRLIQELYVDHKGRPRLKLCDKYKALQKLDILFDLLPDRWHRRMEEEKLAARKGTGRGDVTLNVVSSIPEPEEPRDDVMDEEGGPML
jgi:phage terminase small subunit